MTRKLVAFLLLFSMLLMGCGTNAPQGSSQNSSEYLVLIGEDSSIVEKVSNVDVLVIDASFFTKEDIEALKEHNVNNIYSYLNIGSIEEFRDCYQDFEKYSLGAYENWPDEKWMDVSQPKWQEYLQSASQDLANKGVDGFFVDNVDVYYAFPEDYIFDGIVDILSGLKSFDKTVIINGGDSFVQEYLASNDTPAIFDGVNQESVFTSYDFANQLCLTNDEETVQYYCDYLDMLLEKGYLVHVIEYATNSDLADEAYSFSGDHGYRCYVSNNIELQQ